MSLKSWPASERPREKLIEHGAQSLSDSELLAIFLRTGTRGKNALELARELISSTGGLRQLLSLTLNDIDQFKGFGTAKYVQLQASLEIAKRCLNQNLRENDALESAEQTKQYLKYQLRDCHNEQFACVFLDNRHRVIAFEVLFTGSINRASVYPRVVVQKSLHHNAAALILAHNHPSGIAEPSQSDIDITHTLRDVLSVIDVTVLDHIVIGDQAPISLAEQGYL
ncbi:RadC family protein [Pleionea sediminis]|uniref:RadC family protein n=1 Tax=Pleionea sediminis TaxID=2569479 RepID=UPI001185524D|nr:DNA repair protein RadC [Pleionea sediminis]